MAISMFGLHLKYNHTNFLLGKKRQDSLNIFYKQNTVPGALKYTKIGKTEFLSSRDLPSTSAKRTCINNYTTMLKHYQNKNAKKRMF